MKKLQRIISFFIVLVMIVSFMPSTAFAAGSSSNYIQVTKNKSYTKDGNFCLSFTYKNVSKESDIKISGKLLDPSGCVLWNYKGFEFHPGQKANLGLRVQLLFFT